MRKNIKFQPHRSNWYITSDAANAILSYLKPQCKNEIAILIQLEVFLKNF